MNDELIIMGKPMIGSHFLSCWAVVTAILWAVLAWVVAHGQRSIAFLRDVAPTPARRPRVSVIIPARNEERHLEGALRSVLALDYDPFEVLVIDDRSTDRTAEILAHVADEYPRLQVITVKELPPGWLGKNHEAWTGSQAASGELLLFTDADVMMEPSSLRRAVAYLEGRGLDHLAISPQIHSPGPLVSSLVGCFTLNFSFYAIPWKARDPRSSRSIGVGAFNLIRREVYQAIGTHAALPSNPIDDMRVGKLVKRKGYRQDMLFGRGLIGIEWYASVQELVQGLQKNAFAGAFYRVEVVLAGTLAALAFHVAPFFGLALIPALSGWFSLVAVAILLWLASDNARCHGLPRWCGIVFPAASLVLVYAVWRAMVLTLWNGGILWRGTFYPLEELRR
jgi:hypothetical protein